MQFLSNLKKQRELNTKKGIEEDAIDRYSIVEFAGSLFYAFSGIPAVAIAPDTTAKEIQEHLHTLQDNYIKFQSNKSFNIGTRV